VKKSAQRAIQEKKLMLDRHLDEEPAPVAEICDWCDEWFLSTNARLSKKNKDVVFCDDECCAEYEKKREDDTSS